MPNEVIDAGLDDSKLVPGDWGSTLPADVAEPCLDPVTDPPVRDPFLEGGLPSLVSPLPVTEIVDSALDDVRDLASGLPDSDPACDPRRPEAEVMDAGRDPDAALLEVVDPARDTDLPVTAVTDPGRDD